ncbi:MAG TPA: polyprenyl synthetase family protein [Gemmatimonadales bacterium]|nr:polyprenyl synthetase family protein [Gemmatimonadales bacterium]
MNRYLDPHPENEIEWWYVHGLLAERWMLMVCFWRYRSTRSLPEGVTAAFSLTALDNSVRWQATWLDRPFLAQIRDVARRHLARVPDTYLATFMDATADGEVFSPFALAGGTVLDQAPGRPLRIELGGLELREEPDGAVRIGIDKRELRLDLTLQRPAPGFAMGGGGEEGFRLSGQRMWGWTEPRVPARGVLSLPGGGASAANVEGQCWLDHQWGAWSFAAPRRQLHHPEWLYHAAVLDDGRSLVVCQEQRPRTGNGVSGRESRLAYAVLHCPDGSCRRLARASSVADDRFESLRTNNTYEFGWTLELSEIGGRLAFAPFHRNQEVAVFTRQRGLLEAGCRVEGSLDGTACSGWGFVEAFGEMLDINEYFWGQRKTNLAGQLERFLPRTYDSAWIQRICRVSEPLDQDPATVEGAILGPLWSMMDRGGKGWRSAWLTTCYYAFGADALSEQVRELLPVAELLHTGSLILDDIQDGATSRRSRPALHLEVGEDLAINAGCFCYFLPLVILQELDGITEAQRAGLYNVVLAALRQGHLGQAADLMWSKGRYDVLEKARDFETSRARLLEQYRLKSGCQLEAIARIGGILADAPAEQVEAAAAYSRVFGVVFQILDDLIGINEAEDRLGKSAGEDVRNGKLTVVLLDALHSVNGDRRRSWVQRIFESPNGDRLAAAKALILEADSARHCLDLADAMIARASESLAALPRTDARIVMRSVPRWLIRQQRKAHQA